MEVLTKCKLKLASCRRYHVLFFSCLYFFGAVKVSAQEEVAFLHVGSEVSNKLAIEETSSLSLSFELVSNLMWFKAVVDGQQGNFILDTGVPTLVMNAEVGNNSGNMVGLGAGGQEAQLTEGEVSSFQLAGVEQGQQRSLGLDLSGLASRSDRELLGIVGYEQLREYELLIDYQESTFHLLPARKNELHKQAKPVFSLPFNYLDHLPMVMIKQGNKRLYFAIDTGAGSNLIDPAALERGIVAELTGGRTIVRGLDGGQQEQLNYSIGGLHQRGQSFAPQSFVEVALEHLSVDGQRIDGILGQPFLQQYRLSIDYKRQRIHFW